MKIKTITCHHVSNHGAMLQAYALLTYLSSLGHDVEIIDYNPNLKNQKNLFWQHPKLKKIGLGWLYALIMLPKSLQGRKRRLSFDKFYNKYLKTTSNYYPSIEALRSNPPIADVYIAGSDQIWNTILRNGSDPAFYLDFGTKETRRISYAASFAIPQIQPKYVNFVKKELSNFDNISVREESAVGIVEKLGYNAIQVVDPVFLLNRDQWNDLIDSDKEAGSLTSNHSSLNEKYILVYDFMKDGAVQSIAQRVAQLRNLKIYSIYKAFYADRCYFYANPLDFLRLVRGAECVVSDSFHGTAFSLIFQKDFYVVNRSDGLNTRMKEILSKYSLMERLVSNETPDEVFSSHIDFTIINKSLNNDIKFSQQWLSDNL